MKVFFKIVFLLFAFSCHSQEDVKIEAIYHPLFTNWVKDNNIKTLQITLYGDYKPRSDMRYQRTYNFTSSGILENETLCIIIDSSEIASPGSIERRGYYRINNIKMVNSVDKIKIFERHYSENEKQIKIIKYGDDRLREKSQEVKYYYDGESLIRINFDNYLYSLSTDFKIEFNKKSSCNIEYTKEIVSINSDAKQLIIEYLKKINWNEINSDEITSINIEHYKTNDSSWNYSKYSFEIKINGSNANFIFCKFNDKIQNFLFGYSDYEGCNEVNNPLAINLNDMKRFLRQIKSTETTKQGYTVESNYEFGNKELLKESFIKNADNNILRWIKYDGSFVDFKYDSNGIMIGESESSNFKKNEKDPYHISKRQSNCSLEPYTSLNAMLEKQIKKGYEIIIIK